MSSGMDLRKRMAPQGPAQARAARPRPTRARSRPSTPARPARSRSATTRCSRSTTCTTRRPRSRRRAPSCWASCSARAASCAATGRTCRSRTPSRATCTTCGCPLRKKVIDHFLQFGFVVVSLEEEAPPPFANFMTGKEMAAQSEMGPEANRATTGRARPPDASAARARSGRSRRDADQRQRTRSARRRRRRVQPQPRARRARRRPVRALVRATWASPTTAGSTASSHQLRLGTL